MLRDILKYFVKKYRLMSEKGVIFNFCCLNIAYLFNRETRECDVIYFNGVIIIYMVNWANCFVVMRNLRGFVGLITSLSISMMYVVGTAFVIILYVLSWATSLFFYNRNVF